jgi:DNA polymerase-3 subunit epsilon/oligoribonuclease
MLGIFLDTETNGLNASIHRILELAFRLVDLKTGEPLAAFHSLVMQPIEVWERSDQESLRINGFTFNEISKGKTIRTLSQEILQIFAHHGVKRGKAVFICQNPSFDRAFFGQLIDPDTQELLSYPYHWLDLASMYWALSLRDHRVQKGPLPWETGLSKDLIASRYNLPGEAKPHRAMNGVDHLIACYQAVVGFPEKL